MTAVDFGLRIDNQAGPIQWPSGSGTLATVRDINSAPSLRSALELEKERETAKRSHPAFRMRAQAPTESPKTVPALAQPVSLTRTQTSKPRIAPPILVALRYFVALVGVVAGGFAAGTQLQPAAYSGPTWTHSVAAGESVWGLADRVSSDRALGEVAEDIRVLNDLSTDLLVPGQVVTLPLE